MNYSTWYTRWRRENQCFWRTQATEDVNQGWERKGIRRCLMISKEELVIPHQNPRLLPPPKKPPGGEPTSISTHTAGPPAAVHLQTLYWALVRLLSRPIPCTGHLYSPRLYNEYYLWVSITLLLHLHKIFVVKFVLWLRYECYLLVIYMDKQIV